MCPCSLRLLEKLVVQRKTGSVVFQTRIVNHTAFYLGLLIAFPILTEWEQVGGYSSLVNAPPGGTRKVMKGVLITNTLSGYIKDDHKLHQTVKRRFGP